MYSIIGLKNPTTVVDTWSLHFARRVLDWRLAQAIRYYRENHTYINSENILFKLIAHLGLPKDIEGQYLETIILNKAFKAANSFGFTSYQNIGKVQRNNFYGINTDEIILLKEQFHKWDDVKNRWQNLCPVKVLRHPQNHFSFGLLNNKNLVDTKALAIIEIDINLFHLMYIAWYKHQVYLKKTHVIDLIPNAGFFLGMYVIPNMLLSHTNQVVLNRNIMLTDLSLGKTIDYNPIPKPIPKNYNWLDKDTEAIFERARSGNWSIANIANNIKGVDNEKALSFMETPKTLYNRQNKWAYMLTFTHFVKHCLTVPSAPDRSNQNNYLRPLQRELEYMMNRRAFEAPMWTSVTEPYLEEIEYILNQ